jgi:NADH-quinone oxidoreductase subunit G
MEVFYIDDQPVPFEKGEKILSAALRAGLEIPHFCYHPALSVVGHLPHVPSRCDRSWQRTSST